MILSYKNEYLRLKINKVKVVRFNKWKIFGFFLLFCCYVINFLSY